MAEARTSFAMVVLADGRVLVAGGTFASQLNFATTEIYDPRTERWSAAAPMKEARRLHSAVLLPSGEVLVIGGYRGRQLDSTEIYTPCN